jgi:hypothetical protein
MMSHFLPLNNDRPLSTITTQSTTSSPHKNHVLHTTFPKTPLKNPVKPQKNTSAALPDFFREKRRV